MKVYCYPVDRESTYVPLLFDGIEDSYERVYRQDGSLLDAIEELAAGAHLIVHIHWEEFVLRDCRTEREADAAATAFVQQIAAVHDRGGAIVWTVHNEVPHEIAYHRQFFALRAALARHADVVLLHNAESRRVLERQVRLDPARLRYLPHPSYIGRLEDESALARELHRTVPDGRIQGFGWIRRQKGFGPMIDMLPLDYLQRRNAYVRISGRGPEAAAIAADYARRTDVEWDLRHVPDAEIPSLLRSATCVVLPYERNLTSGVASIATSVGAMIVAVDLPQLRELLPPASHEFLYPQGDAHAFRAAIDRVFAITLDERRSIVDAQLAVARTLRPRNVAQRLAAIYREVVSLRTTGTGSARL